MGINKDKTLEKHYRININNLLNISGLTTFWKDLDGCYSGCNDFPINYFGFKSKDDIHGLTDFDLPILRNEAQRMRDGDLEVINTGQPIQIRYSITTKKSIIQFQTFKAPLLDEAGHVVGTYGIDHILDVVQLKNALTSSQQTTLTKRQEDCLFYLAQGFTIKKIAHTLSLSPRTIEHYLENIKVKLNCYSRDELIQHAFRSTYFQEKIKSFK